MENQENKVITKDDIGKVITEDKLNKIIEQAEAVQTVTEEELKQLIALGHKFDLIIESNAKRNIAPVPNLDAETNLDKTHNEEHIIKDIEDQIRNKMFASKEELKERLIELRYKGKVSLTNAKINELLNLYDNLYKGESPLDMTSYKQVETENSDLIVATEKDRILNTIDLSSEFEDEFKQTQNEIIANSQSGQANADEVFESMAKHQKEEVTLMPIMEAISKDDIDTEILNKIKFFITNSHVSPYAINVDISSGIFYDKETSQVYEVRKNKDTGTYEIYTENKKEDSLEETEENSKELEEISNKNRLNRPKARVRTKPSRMDSAAFTKLGFLIINIITFSLLITMAILLKK